VQINKIAQMKKTRDAVLIALVSRLGEIDIGRLVWLKKRRHSPPAAHAVAALSPNTFRLESVLTQR
jgi:hypothetical protein